MKPYTIMPMTRLISLLLLGLCTGQAALAVTIPHVANCYSGDNGYDLYIANNSAFATIQANYIFSNNSNFYEYDTGTFHTAPPSSVGALATGAFCYYDKESYEGNWLSYSVGGVGFKLQFWGSGDNYFLNLQPVNSGDWTTDDGTACPGESGWAAAVSAVNNSTAQTICDGDYIVNIATAGLGGSDNGVIMTVMDNPAGTAGGSQTASGSSANSAEALAAPDHGINAAPNAATDSGRYVLASRIFNKSRWAVVRNPNTLAISGMRYAQDGLQHDKFVHCTFQRDDGNPDIYRRQSTYDCQVAQHCTSVQCGSADWQMMRETVTLPGTFFNRRPINNLPLKPMTPPVGGDADMRQALQLLPGSVNQRKIHQTPDGKIKLISVNLLNQEWALAYDGQTLFAMVPHGAMGQPRFVQCQQTASNQSEVTLDCAAAYRCRAGACTDGQWAALATVKLPQSFFSLPQPSNNGACSSAADGTQTCYWKRPR